MTQPQVCVACHHIGYDVGPRLVRVEPTETERAHGHVVPVAFEVQVRCVDKLRVRGPSTPRKGTPK